MMQRFYKFFFLGTFSLIAHGFDANDFYADYQKILGDVYGTLDAVISADERTCVTQTGGSPVYGEITFDSVNFLLAQLNLTKDDVFYDLGSGLGKLVYQVFLMTPVKKSVGIEFSQSRFDRAHALTPNMPKIYKQTYKFENGMRRLQVKPLLPKIKKKSCTFIKGCMIEQDFFDATVVFTCSTCFGPEFMHKLAHKCAAIDKLRVITLKQLPYHEHVHYNRMFQLPMTWSNNVPVYMYTVDHSKIAEQYPVHLEKTHVP